MPHVASREAVIQMVELRRALEAEVAALAAERRTPEDVQRIRDAIDALRRPWKRVATAPTKTCASTAPLPRLRATPFLIGALQCLRQFLHGATRVTRANEARRADFAAWWRRAMHASSKPSRPAIRCAREAGQEPHGQR